MQTYWPSTRALKALLAVLTFVAVVFSASGASSQVQDFVYAAKYVCGQAAILPNQPAPPVAPGTYNTAVNVINVGPSIAPLPFRKRFVIALPNEQQGGFISPWFTATLNFDEAFEIDCEDIFKHLATPTAPPPKFAKGFVILWSQQRQLEVVAVYTTAAASSGPVTSIAVERVPKRP